MTEKKQKRYPTDRLKLHALLEKKEKELVRLREEVEEIRKLVQQADAPPFQSGDFEAKSRHVSKRGSSTLRRTLFQICSMSLCRADPEDPIFCFMDKKRSEGKHFYVYTVAGAAKFLRIYYARVKQYLNQMETASASVSPN